MLNNKILITQCIFIPNESKLEEHIQSSISILENCKTYSNVVFRFGGWVLNDKIWDLYVDSLSEYNIEFHRFEDNVGKAKVINTITRENDDFRYMLTCDSDVILDYEPDLLTILTKIYNKTRKTNKIGLLALNQAKGQPLETVRKTYGALNRMKEKILDEVYEIYQCRRLAGPVLFIEYNLFRNIGGYREYSIYGGNDGGLCLDVLTKKLKLGLVTNLYFTHLPSNAEYTKWKHKQHKIINKQLNKSLSVEDFKKIQQKELKDFWGY